MKELKFSVVVFVLVAALMFGASIKVISASAAIPMATLAVYPGNMQGWQATVSTAGAQSVTFENGPTPTPLAPGSVELAIIGANGGGAAQLRHPGYALQRLDQITNLNYYAHVTQFGSGGQAPYILLNLDYNGDTTLDDQIFFEPLYQSGHTMNVPDQGPLVLNTWQNWNALAGGWWSLNNIAGAGPGANVKTLAQYLAAQPNARIINTGTGLGGLRVVAGFGAPAWDNFIGNVDAFTIGVNTADTTYDFNAGAPTAATVSVGGRVTNSNGRAMSKAAVTLTGSQNTRAAITNPFGYFKFDGVEVGGTYTVSVSRKGYTFSPQVVTPADNIEDLNFTAQP